MKLTPLHDYVILKPTKRKAQTVSGILLPSDEKERDRECEVVKVGERVQLPDLIGKTVFVDDVYDATKVKEDGVEYIMVRARDILAIYG